MPLRGKNIILYPEAPLNGIVITPDIFPVRTRCEEGRHVAQTYNDELKIRWNQKSISLSGRRPAQISRAQYPDDPDEADADKFMQIIRMK